MIVTKLSIFILGLVISMELFADEVARPIRAEELIWGNPTTEEMVGIVGVEVAWVNEAALKRDFPQLFSLNSYELKAWLVENFSYIGSQQTKLDGIRNSPIPLAQRFTRHGYRPSTWKRAALLEVFAPQGSTVIGLIDVKGIGHGAQSGDTVEHMVEEASRGGNLDFIKSKDHSDGLMSFGEAIAEMTRQMAAQMLFEMETPNLETVESYAILKLPFSILKPKGEEIPAALYLRQAHLGRSNWLEVPSTVYDDNFGGKQKTSSNAAVDFGGVQIKDARVAHNFEPLNATRYFDAQTSKPWAWGHDVARAFSRLHNPDKAAVERHLNEMLAPLHDDYIRYLNSPAHHERELLRADLKMRARQMLERKSCPSLLTPAK